MEQYSQYLMWVKSKNIMNSFSHSWEEQAFAEDALGPLGGFIWPPRSYSCSFCGREFRSAQALGGHMNVHRRERAKLKQSLNSNSSPQSEETIDPHHHNPSQSQNPSFYPSSLSPSMVSVPLLAQETFCSISDTKSSISDEQVVATGHDNTVETNLFVGLTLDFSGNYSNRVGREDGEIVCCKKQKIGVMLPMSSMEEIDLELRLGDLPTVK